MRCIAWFLTLVVIASLLAACSPGTAIPVPPTRVAQGATPTPTVVAAATPSGAGLVTIEQINGSPDQFRDKAVKVRGAGIAVATYPLCPGYVGFDRRVVFFESPSGGPSICAVNRLPSGVRSHYDTPQVFEGYVRVFSGDIGCPGEVKHETFPYLEITGVVSAGPDSVGAAVSPTPCLPTPSASGPGATPAPASSARVLVDDPSFVKLTALPNPGHTMWWATDVILEVQAKDASRPVAVSYLMTDPSATPGKPTPNVQIRGNNFTAGWDPGEQYYFCTWVGSQSQPAYAANPQYFPLPHYRTCILTLGTLDTAYVVFLRENDGRVTYRVLKGKPFTSLDIDALAKVTWQDGVRFEVRSYGGPVEVGLWVNGRYQHDEVAGATRPEYAQNPKYYYLDHSAGHPSNGMLMLMVGRYQTLALVLGSESEGHVAAVTLTSSHAWQRETISGLADLSALIPRTPGVPAKVEVRATGSSPVEVSHFGFDNTCWQWEVNGAAPGYAPNPQSFVLKHYTPALLMASRYDLAGVFLYNENDSQIGVIPVAD
jgi:hypothetical protein